MTTEYAPTYTQAPEMYHDPAFEADRARVAAFDEQITAKQLEITPLKALGRDKTAIRAIAKLNREIDDLRQQRKAIHDLIPAPKYSASHFCAAILSEFARQYEAVQLSKAAMMKKLTADTLHTLEWNFDDLVNYEFRMQHLTLIFEIVTAETQDKPLTLKILLEIITKINDEYLHYLLRNQRALSRSTSMISNLIEDAKNEWIANLLDNRFDANFSIRHVQYELKHDRVIFDEETYPVTIPTLQ